MLLVLPGNNAEDVVADGEVTIVEAVNEDTQLIVAEDETVPSLKVTVEVNVVDVGAASVTVNDASPAALVISGVVTVWILRPAETYALAAIPLRITPKLFENVAVNVIEPPFTTFTEVAGLITMLSASPVARAPVTVVVPAGAPAVVVETSTSNAL
jgi:hypothetical protein